MHMYDLGMFPQNKCLLKRSLSVLGYSKKLTYKEVVLGVGWLSSAIKCL